MINCITLWNTVYLDRILTQLRAAGHEVREEDVARLHPYMYAHINVHGHYAFQPPNLVAGIGSRRLRNPDLPDDEESAGPVESTFSGRTGDPAVALAMPGVGRATSEIP